MVDLLYFLCIGLLIQRARMHFLKIPVLYTELYYGEIPTTSHCLFFFHVR